MFNNKSDDCYRFVINNSYLPDKFTNIAWKMKQIMQLSGYRCGSGFGSRCYVDNSLGFNGKCYA